MNIKKILISGVVVWLITSILGWLTCGWLFNGVYQIPPNIWKSEAAIMSVNNIIGSTLTGLISAMLFVLVFAVLYKGIPNKGLKKGLTYGFLVWLVGGLVGIANMPFYMAISSVVVIYWIIQSLVMNLINGLVVAAIYKPKKK